MVLRRKSYGKASRSPHVGCVPQGTHAVSCSNDLSGCLKGFFRRPKQSCSCSLKIQFPLRRRELGIKYKNLTPSDKLREIYARNVEKYGDKLGPSIDWLRKKGKSWDDIIESASRTGGKDLGL